MVSCAPDFSLDTDFSAGVYRKSVCIMSYLTTVSCVITRWLDASVGYVTLTGN